MISVWSKAEAIRFFEKTGISTCVHGMAFTLPCLVCWANNRPDATEPERPRWLA